MGDFSVVSVLSNSFTNQEELVEKLINHHGVERIRERVPSVPRKQFKLQQITRNRVSRCPGSNLTKCCQKISKKKTSLKPEFRKDNIIFNNSEIKLKEFIILIEKLDIDVKKTDHHVSKMKNEFMNTTSERKNKPIHQSTATTKKIETKVLKNIRSKKRSLSINSRESSQMNNVTEFSKVSNLNSLKILVPKLKNFTELSLVMDEYDIKTVRVPRSIYKFFTKSLDPEDCGLEFVFTRRNKNKSSCKRKKKSRSQNGRVNDTLKISDGLTKTTVEELNPSSHSTIMDGVRESDSTVIPSLSLKNHLIKKKKVIQRVSSRRSPKNSPKRSNSLWKQKNKSNRDILDKVNESIEKKILMNFENNNRLLCDGLENFSKEKSQNYQSNPSPEKNLSLQIRKSLEKSGLELCSSGMNDGILIKKSVNNDKASKIEYSLAAEERLRIEPVLCTNNNNNDDSFNANYNKTKECCGLSENNHKSKSDTHLKSSLNQHASDNVFVHEFLSTPTKKISPHEKNKKRTTEERKGEKLVLSPTLWGSPLSRKKNSQAHSKSTKSLSKKLNLKNQENGDSCKNRNAKKKINFPVK